LKRLSAVAWGLVGLLTGALLGLYLSLAVFVARARAGSYVFSVDELVDLRWEAIPLVGAAVGGAYMGAVRPQTLGWVVGLAIAGALLAAPAGWLVGDGVWRDQAGSWAGAILASALGLLGGGALGVQRAPPPTPAVSGSDAGGASRSE
jgi:hypothetical protein